jgi:hypothetical protein
MKTGTLIGAGVFALIVVGFLFWAIGLSNTEKKLYLTGKAAQNQTQVIFDNTWKTIRDQANVTDNYKDDFKEIYIGMMEGRYKNDAVAGQQSLMKWVQESNPTLDASIYKTLMNTIEGSRKEFTFQQEKLIDIDRQHKSLRATFPNTLIIGGRPDLEIKLVTSAKTEEAFKTGQDNDNLIKREPKPAVTK